MVTKNRINVTMVIITMVFLGVTMGTSSWYQTPAAESCGGSLAFSPCSVKTVFALVQQAVNDFNSPFGQSSPESVLAVINKGGAQYKVGKFSLQVYDDHGVKVADSANPSTNGLPVSKVFDKTSILTDPHFVSNIISAGSDRGSWAYAYAYNWTKKEAPTPLRFWTSSVVAEGTRYSFASALENREAGAIKESCTADYFTECSATIAYYLAEKVKKDLTFLNISSSLFEFFDEVRNSSEYHVVGGFDASIVNSEGNVLVEGKTGLNIPASHMSDFVAAAAAGGSWVAYNTTASPAQERQAWVTSALFNGQTYYIYSSISTAEKSACPACNCPVCEHKECTPCHPISDCDTVDVTKVKFDFDGLV